MVWIDDDKGFRVSYRWRWKRLWLKLSEKERKEFNSIWGKMYKKFCERLKNKSIK